MCICQSNALFWLGSKKDIQLQLGFVSQPFWGAPGWPVLPRLLPPLGISGMTFLWAACPSCQPANNVKEWQSKHWRNHWPLPVAWTHPVFIHHQTLDGSDIFPFTPAVQVRRISSLWKTSNKSSNKSWKTFSNEYHLCIVCMEDCPVKGEVTIVHNN